MFEISPETVRNWASEFSRHLSPATNPPTGKTRKFDENDLQVFATIARLKREGMVFAEIHRALDDGIRDNPPDVPDELLDLASSNAGVKLLSLLQDLSQRVELLEARGNSELRQEIAQLKADRDNLLKQIGRLEARLEMEQEKNRDE